MMSDDIMTPGDQLALSLQRQIDAICDEFEARWLPPGNIPVEPLLDRVPVEARSRLLCELMRVERALRERHDLSIERSDHPPRAPGERPVNPWALLFSE